MLGGFEGGSDEPCAVRRLSLRMVVISGFGASGGAGEEARDGAMVGSDGWVLRTTSGSIDSPPAAIRR